MTDKSVMNTVVTLKIVGVIAFYGTMTYLGVSFVRNVVMPWWAEPTPAQERLPDDYLRFFHRIR